MSNRLYMYPVWLQGVDQQGVRKVVELLAYPGQFTVRMFPEQIKALEARHSMTLQAIYTDRPDNRIWSRGSTPEPDVDTLHLEALHALAECRDAVAEFGVKINAAYARIRQAREAAGVKPGEPLLDLNLPEHPTKGTPS